MWVCGLEVVREIHNNDDMKSIGDLKPSEDKEKALLNKP